MKRTLFGKQREKTFVRTAGRPGLESFHDGEVGAVGIAGNEHLRTQCGDRTGGVSPQAAQIYGINQRQAVGCKFGYKGILAFKIPKGILEWKAV